MSPKYQEGIFAYLYGSAFIPVINQGKAHSMFYVRITANNEYKIQDWPCSTMVEFDSNPTKRRKRRRRNEEGEGAGRRGGRRGGGGRRKTRRSVSLQTHIKSASFVVAHICNPNSPIAGRDTEIRESPRSHLLRQPGVAAQQKQETRAQEQDGRED